MQNFAVFQNMHTHRSSQVSLICDSSALDCLPGFLPTPPKCAHLRALSYTCIYPFLPVSGCVTPNIPDALSVTPFHLGWVFPICSLHHHTGILSVIFLCCVFLSLLDYEQLEPCVLHLCSSQCFDIQTHKDFTQWNV